MEEENMLCRPDKGTMMMMMIILLSFHDNDLIGALESVSLATTMYSVIKICLFLKGMYPEELEYLDYHMVVKGLNLDSL
jgi:hypothetical protein